MSDSAEVGDRGKPEFPGGEALAALRVAGLAKSFAGRRVLHPFDMHIAPGEVRALLGQNGSGKSTLIKILSGMHVPDDGGTCLVKGAQLEFGDSRSSHEVGLRFVHQDLGLIPGASIADNLSFTAGFPTRFGSVRGREQRALARQALDRVGLDLDPRTAVDRLSPAQRTGVAVARAMGFHADSAAVLVLDEPTATLPESEVNHLHVMVRQAADQGVGILYVTHHLDEVFRLADTVSVLRDGYMVESAPTSAVTRDALIHTLVGRELEEVQRSATSASKVGGAALTVTALHSESLNEVSFEVRAGEIVGFYGLTGSGRESILGTIFGAVPRSGGTVLAGQQEIAPHAPVSAKAAGVAYVPPDRKATGVFMHLNATENLMMADVKSWHGIAMNLRTEQSEVGDWFDRLEVSPRTGEHAEMATFSGGNQQKIVFGKWLRTRPRVLLLDEPTQGVDVGAKAGLHRQIIAASAEGLAVAVSTSDVDELAALCDRVIFLDKGRIVGEKAGGGFNETEITRTFHELTDTEQGSAA